MRSLLGLVCLALVAGSQATHEICVNSQLVELTCMGTANYQRLAAAIATCSMPKAINPDAVNKAVHEAEEKEDKKKGRKERKGRKGKKIKGDEEFDLLEFVEGATLPHLCVINELNLIKYEKKDITLNRAALAGLVQSTHLGDDMTDELTNEMYDTCRRVAKDTTVNTFFADKDCGMTAKDCDCEDECDCSSVCDCAGDCDCGEECTCDGECHCDMRLSKAERKAKKAAKKAAKAEKKAERKARRAKRKEEEGHTVVALQGDDDDEVTIDLQAEYDAQRRVVRKEIDLMIKPVAFFRCYKGFYDRACKNKIYSLFEMIARINNQPQSA